ncbi:hypothetical protein FPV67DRAFT_1422926 [Lyophyllum atratum]|nr:hypothetical protein FPV67DRAFT_1422926 [Lyophyllum atratum]
MMSFILSPFIEAFRYTLQPIAPFTWFGLGISTLDVVATVRLCLLLRQIREQLYLKHVSTKGASGLDQSFVKSLSATLTVVYGGEAVIAPLLGVPPSFMVSGTVPALYAAIQAMIEALPAVPDLSAELELPISIIDGFTRAYLLCNLIPPSVTTHASPAISGSPWTLLVASLVTANGGFFFTNMLSLLSPTPLALATPPELQPYGWTTADLWCAPAITGLYALLTHAQPFWADAHGLIATLLGGARGEKGVEALDPEVARAVCAVLLSGLFFGRTVRNFGLWKRFGRIEDVKGSTLVFSWYWMNFGGLMQFFCRGEGESAVEESSGTAGLAVCCVLMLSRYIPFSCLLRCNEYNVHFLRKLCARFEPNSDLVPSPALCDPNPTLAGQKRSHP